MRMMQDDRNEGRAICLYSSPDERLKSAAACLLATYFVGVLSSLPLASLTETRADPRGGTNPLGNIPPPLGILLHPVPRCRPGGIRSRDWDTGCVVGGLEGADVWACGV